MGLKVKKIVKIDIKLRNIKYLLVNDQVGFKGEPMQQNNFHLAIPMHLSKMLVPMGNHNESYVNGVICCPCGSETFSIQIVDMIGNEDKEKATIVIQATCIFCGEKHEIFHNKKHGWNQLVSGDSASSD